MYLLVSASVGHSLQFVIPSQAMMQNNLDA